MSKDDAPVPDVIPRKRRQIEQAPPVWLATWLGRDDLSASDRKRLEAERQRRKELARVEHSRVGVIVAREGITPTQLAELTKVLRELDTTELLHHTLTPKVHGSLMAVCREMEIRGVRVPPGDEHRAVIDSADTVVALPKETRVLPHATPGVWEWIGLAKHRSVPVVVVLANGQREGGSDA